MDDNQHKKKDPKPGRIEAFRELPADIMRSFSKEELRAFLYEDKWPDSLAEKLKDYIVDD